MMGDKCGLLTIEDRKNTSWRLDIQRKDSDHLEIRLCDYIGLPVATFEISADAVRTMGEMLGAETRLLTCGDCGEPSDRVPCYECTIEQLEDLRATVAALNDRIRVADFTLSEYHNPQATDRERIFQAVRHLGWTQGHGA